MHPSLPDFYTVTTSAGEGGSVSESQEVPRGSTATFYIAANEGYYISDVYVDGTSVGPVTSYTFEDIDSDHTIMASFGKE